MTALLSASDGYAQHVPTTWTNSPVGSVRLPSPLTRLQDDQVERSAVRLYLKREDLIDPEVSGNKWRKLKKVRLLTHLTRRIRLRATPASVDA
jgi:hypothetical protein